MTNTFLKETILKYRCNHSTWLSKFSNNLSTGTCVESSHYNNIVITSLLQILDYQNIETVVTNKAVFTQVGEITACNPIYGKSYKIAINHYFLEINVDCNVNGFEVLKENLENAGFIVEIIGNQLIVRYVNNTLITSASFEVRQFVNEDYIETTSELEELEIKEFNCLEEKEICSLFNKLEELLKNCNCNCN